MYPVPAAVYMPTVASSPVIWYGMRRVVTAYSGPLLQVQRASDNATMDVAQLASGLPDNAAVATWAAGSKVYARTWYDQTGQGRHAVQTTLAQMPFYDAAGARGQNAAFGAFKAMVLDGWLDVVAGNIRRPKKLPIPVGAAFNFENHTVVSVIAPKSSIANDIYWAFARASGGSEATAMGTSSGVSGLYAGGGPGNSTSGRRIRAQYQTIANTSTLSNNKFFMDGGVYSSSVKWSDPLAGGVIGDGIPGSTDFMANGDSLLAFGIYPTALSDAQAGQVRDALNATFGIPTPTGVQIVEVGDSIQYGAMVNESREGSAPITAQRPLLNGNPALYNMGLSSQFLTGGGGLAASAGTREDLILDVAYPVRVLFSQIGGNDFASGGNTPGFGATLYSAYGTYVAARRSAGFTKVVMRTILPRSWSAQQAIEVASFNALVRANSIGADAISDVAAHPIMGDVANIGNPLYYQGDNVHPTSFGDELLAPIDAAAINSVL